MFGTKYIRKSLLFEMWTFVSTSEILGSREFIIIVVVNTDYILLVKKKKLYA